MSKVPRYTGRDAHWAIGDARALVPMLRSAQTRPAGFPKNKAIRSR
jgi:hypothetical protein